MSVWLHRFALLTAGATFPLLFIGGLVTSKGAGLAVPDWPTTFGYPMFLYPWSNMVGDIFYEHSHRLAASLVGFLTLVLACLLWLHEKRKWVSWLGFGALGLVVVQGVVGGLRVVLLKETLALIHACLAQIFFALTVSLAVFTSRRWAEGSAPIELSDARRARRLCLWTTAIIYLQVVLGAVLRFTGAGLDAHLFVAGVVAVHVLLIGLRALKFHSDRPHLLWPSLLLGALLVVQLGLGLAAYLGKLTSLGAALPPFVVVLLTTTHVVTGALMLATSLVLTLSAYRSLEIPDNSARPGFDGARQSSATIATAGLGAP